MVAYGVEYGISGLYCGTGLGAELVAPEWIDIGDPVAGTGQLTPVFPDFVAGDFLCVALETQSSSTALNTANGFEATPDSPQAVSSGTLLTCLKVFYKIAEADDDAAPIIGAPSNHSVAVPFVIRGVDPDDPFDVTSGQVTEADGGSATFLTDTTTGPRRLIVGIAAHGIDSAAEQFDSMSASALTDPTERFDEGTAAGNGGGLCIVSGVKEEAGSIGTFRVNLAAGSSGFGTIMLALRPIGG